MEAGFEVTLVVDTNDGRVVVRQWKEDSEVTNENPEEMIGTSHDYSSQEGEMHSTGERKGCQDTHGKYNVMLAFLMHWSTLNIIILLYLRTLPYHAGRRHVYGFYGRCWRSGFCGSSYR